MFYVTRACAFSVLVDFLLVSSLTKLPVTSLMDNTPLGAELLNVSTKVSQLFGNELKSNKDCNCKDHLHCRQLIHNHFKIHSSDRVVVILYKIHISKLPNQESHDPYFFHNSWASVSLEKWWITLSSNQCLMFPNGLLMQLFKFYHPYILA